MRGDLVACRLEEVPEQDLLVPPYTLGAWLGDGTTAAAQLTCADPEIIMQIEAEGIEASRSEAAVLRYHLQLPSEKAVPQRDCVVCGRQFTPRTSQVRTCGQSCGGRARFVSAPVAAPTCSNCGGPSCGLRLCQACRNTIGSLQARLRTVGVLGNKHIPVAYLRGSELQRRRLLADGGVRPGDAG